MFKSLFRNFMSGVNSFRHQHDYPEVLFIEYRAIINQYNPEVYPYFNLTDSQSALLESYHELIAEFDRISENDKQPEHIKKTSFMVTLNKMIKRRIDDTIAAEKDHVSYYDYIDKLKCVKRLEYLHHDIHKYEKILTSRKTG